MAHLFRKNYTRPIPQNAAYITHKGKPAVRFVGRDGKPTIGILTADGSRCRIRSGSWVGRYVNEDGRKCEVSLSPDRAAAESMLNELTRKVEKVKAGITDDYTEHRKIPLATHLEAYRKHQEERGNTPEQTQQAYRRCESVFIDCGFLRLPDLNAETVSAWLADKRKLPRNKGGIGARTSNHYATTLKAFGNWCVKTRRLQENPFRFLVKVNCEVDVRHKRRPLTVDEFRRLIETAKAGKPFRRLSGPDRAALYFTAAATGLRASELRSLTPASFDFTATPPTVTVAAGYSKHRREDVLPLHPDLVAFVQPWLADRPATGPLWPGNWAKHKEAGDCMRRDLRDAKAAWVAEASTDNERQARESSDFLTYRDSADMVADFHALRHRFITELAKAGVHPKDAKELARHSTITLTMDRYSHVGIRDQAAALAKLTLPPTGNTPEVAEVRMTGTDSVSNLPPNLPPSRGEERGRLSNNEKTDIGSATASDRKNRLENQGKTNDSGRILKLPSARIERATPSLGNRQTDSTSHSQAKTSENTPSNLPPSLPPDVAKIVAAWPTLPPVIRRAMLAMIEAGQGQ